MMDTEDIYDTFSDNDDDVPDNVHNRLLGAVSNLYKLKRIKAPVRKESSLQVSDYHLTNTNSEDKKNGKIEISELTPVLEKRSSHTKINDHIKSIKQKTNKLPKPLEKPQADRLKRSVGYDNMKKELNKWVPIVNYQRVAEQLSFPLKKPQMEIKNNNHDFLTTFKNPTELELKLAQSLDSSKILQKEKEEKEMDDFKVNLENIKNQRSLMARMRAQLSYREAKAARQNKIKSKKFHRILRQEKVKKQIKEFEELQKSDPEAALTKLEQLEKSRAQERASLRHRTTGHWARNLAVRAKYNKEARIALSEQLTKSRELTEKTKKDYDSEDEDMVDKDMIYDEDKNQLEHNNDFVGDNNGSDPNDGSDAYDSGVDWMDSESKNEVKEFYSKFEEYENNKKNENASKYMTTEVASKNNNFTCRSSKTSVTVETDDSLSYNKNIFENNNTFKKSKRNINNNNNKILNKTKNESYKKNSEVNIQSKDSNVEVQFSVLKRNPIKIEYKSSSVLCSKKLPLKTGSWSVTSVKHKKSDLLKSPKRKKIYNDNDKKITHKCNFDDMFYEVEDKLNKEVSERVKKIKRSIESDKLKETNSKTVILESQPIENNLGLQLKSKKLTAQIDEELNETSNLPANKLNGDFVDKIIEKNSSIFQEKPLKPAVKESVDMNLNNISISKKKSLFSDIPTDSVTDDHIDDEESLTNEKPMTISEAFACEDIDKEFRDEKEEEIKNSQVSDVDLTIPGWGSWGGPNIKPSENKKKRFIIKFPKQLPRRDENKGNVVINEDKDKPLKPYLVTELPYPFTSIKEYEASIRAPIGSTWLSQTAHQKLIAPPVITKLGHIIEPMSKDIILKT